MDIKIIFAFAEYTKLNFKKQQPIKCTCVSVIKQKEFIQYI